MGSLEERHLAKDFNRARGSEAHEADWLAAPLVAILLCTRNGARFLGAQLASLEQQQHSKWQLVVSDDGSSDATLVMIRNFAQRVPQRVEVRVGPGRGPSANFMTLAANSSIEGDYFAFCDQDDIWYPYKLSRALAQLQSVPQDVPAAYGGRTRLIAADCTPLGYSPRFSKTPSFANALSQNIAGANTMLLNGAAKRLLERAGPVDVVSHDWWTYQLVAGSGGVFHYDPEPHLDYRQHDDNAIGCNRGAAARWKRLRMILNGGFARWNDLNLAALQRSRQLLTEEARAHLDAFTTMRRSGLIGRFKAFVKMKIRRQTFAGNVALLMAVLLKKI